MDDTVALRFAEQVGNDEAYHALAARAGQYGIQLGGDLLPAAPGQGPDFFLATQAVRDYPGAWMMSEVPRELWPELPLSATSAAVPPRAHPGNQYSPLSGTRLTNQALALCIERGLLPASLARERLAAMWNNPELAPGGWAITDEVIGADGTLRRWLYRYDSDPHDRCWRGMIPQQQPGACFPPRPFGKSESYAHH